MQRRSILLGSGVILGAVTLGLAGASLAVGAGPIVGKAAPEFSAVDANGKRVKLSDFRGKTVVLEWTNHQCPFVRKHYGSGNMQALQKEATGQGVVWLTILSSAKGEQGFVTPAEAKKLIAEGGAAPSHYLFDTDGKIGKQYAATVTPHMYVIDAAGKLAYMGGIDDKPTTRQDDVKTARPFVREALAAVKAGKPMEPASTRAYGCTIKYAS